MVEREIPAGPTASNSEVDLLVIGSGTGMAAALAANELGLDVLVVEKTEYVGGSTARSGGAFWIPPNQVLTEAGADNSADEVRSYLESLVGEDSARDRWEAFVTHGAEAVAMLERTTPMKFFWARYYSDYHPEHPGGSAEGRSCECLPFDASLLGEERGRFRPGVMEAPVPMPVTGADYKWMNLIARRPLQGVPRVTKRVIQGVGGKVLGREYMAGGQALAAGMFAGLIRAQIPVWTRAQLTDLIVEEGRVVGAQIEQDGREVQVRARRGVVLATGGFDHDLALRQQLQSPILSEDLSLGSPGNTGDGIAAGQRVGAETKLMDQAWWFPSFAPVGDGPVQICLAERSLPGSLLVNEEGQRFINEATDYMSFGQRVLELADEGHPVGTMWLVFDKKYRDSYVLAGSLFPTMAIPQSWYDAGIAATGKTPRELAAGIGVPPEQLEATLRRFNQVANLGVDHDFGRGQSAYDRYYGDPTITPNPNLRPLKGTLYAVKMVLSDLGTCGGLVADARGRVLGQDQQPIAGLYSLGNNAANVFGRSYPGAGATIGQGLVYGLIVAREAAANR